MKSNFRKCDGCDNIVLKKNLTLVPITGNKICVECVKAIEKYIHQGLTEVVKQRGLKFKDKE